MKFLGCLLFLNAGASFLPRSRSRGVSGTEPCKAGLCGGMAKYPVSPGISFYSTFNVPGLPKNQSAYLDVTYFIYTNIFFDGGCPQGKMNQFVNQLMLGSPLFNSSGPPSYDPIWTNTATWIFAAQYFMEIYDNNTAKAAAGEVFSCTEGEILWTEYSLDEEWKWTLKMGVLGDPLRTSVLVSTQPYMGLLANETSSWSEPSYSHAFLNGCWELYGVSGGTNYPSSSSVYDMRTVRPPGTNFPWQETWSDVEWANCPGHPNGTFSEIHNVGGVC